MVDDDRTQGPPWPSGSDPGPVPPPPVAPPGFGSGLPSGPPPPFGSSPPPGPGVSGLGPNPYAVGPMMGPGGYGPPPDNNMGWAIAALVVGFLIGGIVGLGLGIVALVKASQVSSKWMAGDFAGAEKSAKGARTWAIVALILGPLIGVAVIALYISAGAFDTGLRMVIPAL